jgi:hypothetical protein
MATADPIILGATGLTLVSRKYRYSAKDGETCVETWEGAETQALAAYATYKTDTQWDSVELDQAGGTAKRTVTLTKLITDSFTNFTNLDNTTWELLPWDNVRDLRQHPYFAQSISLATEYAVCDQMLASGMRYNGSDGPMPEIVARYYAMRSNGIENYIESGAILRNTIVTDSRSTLQVSWKRVNRIISLNKTDANATDPAIDPPTNLVKTINSLQRLKRNIALTIPYTDDVYEAGKWEWVKRMPTIRAISGTRKYEVAYDYYGGEHVSAVLFGGTWDPHSWSA